MLRRIAMLMGLASIVGLVLMQSPAAAGHGDISVPIDTIVEADEGEVVQLASVSVDSELVGTTCDWEFHATNQESVNPGNDLILSSGGTDTVIPGVEDAPNQILDVAGSITLGETLTVSVRLGPNEIFSAGLSVELVCEENVVPSTTTTAAPASETSTTAPTLTTSTSTPPTVETEVAGQVETAPALAVTGPSSPTGPLTVAALLLLIGGVSLSVATRGRP